MSCDGRKFAGWRGSFGGFEALLVLQTTIEPQTVYANITPVNQRLQAMARAVFSFPVGYRRSPRRAVDHLPSDRASAIRTCGGTSRPAK